MFKVSINIRDNKGATNFAWSATTEDVPTRAALSRALSVQIQKAQDGAQRVIDGARIGRIRPTNLLTFDVKEYDGTWHDIEVMEQMSQLGNMRLFSKSNGTWRMNEFDQAIDWVLTTMGIE